LGHLWNELDTASRLLAAYYLLSADPMSWIAALRPDWPEPVSRIPAERAAQIGLNWDSALVFPWIDRLSPSIDSALYVESLLQQPNLFIRIRPRHEANVRQKLERDSIPYQSIAANSLSLSNSTSLESRFEIDREIVVQDLSSQRIAELFAALPERNSWLIWDACAASGGKSILAFDHLPRVQLTCTDLRPAILRNLQSRLERAGVPVERIEVDDLTEVRDRSGRGLFDLILADVPCTGSGTWSRIEGYANRQFILLAQLMHSLKPDGYLLYMTCSVFQAENEGMIDRICQSSGMEVVAMQSFTGYSDKADTLFAALLKRSS
jgi:16S rRNA (cytosine967-C5)-methyltransferase